MIRRLFTLQPGLVGSAAAAVYVAAAMLYRTVFAHTGVLAPDELVAAIAAVYAAWARTKVTPLARPRGAAGQPLVSMTAARPAPPGDHWPIPEPPRM